MRLPLALLVTVAVLVFPVRSRAEEEPAPAPSRLHRAEAWAYQLQGLEVEGAVDRLARAPADVLVIEATNTVRGQEAFPTRRVVRRLRGTPGRRLARKVVLGYVNVGQAEDYRTYWAEGWKAPAKETRGHPAFILGVDPEGWEGNYPVAYWEARWQRVLYGHAEALVDRALKDGFDGAYLDWVLGFENAGVKAAAEAAGVDPAVAMAHLIRDLRAYARRERPGFLVVAQNPGALLARVPAFAGWADGVAQEGLSFRGKAGAAWDHADAGDIGRPALGPESTASVARLLSTYQEAGLPVFVVDYAAKPENQRLATAVCRHHGFIPCVTRTPLDRLPDALFASAPDDPPGR